MPTTTPTATVSLRVYGPNLGVLTDGETFHVHAADCADCADYEARGHHENPFGFTSLRNVVTSVYPPSDFEYDEHGDEYREYERDFRVFSCVRWPTQESPEVAAVRERADKACAEYETVLDEVVSVPDDEPMDKRLLRRWDRAYARALGSCAALTRMLAPAHSNGSLSAPRRQAEPKPLRPGAASKDGMMVCVGLGEGFPPGCNIEKPVTKFPTTNNAHRATECRECRNARRAKKEGS